MPKFYNDEGNLEVWEAKPEGYYTQEEWEAANPGLFPPGEMYNWNGSEWVLDETKINALNSEIIKSERNHRARCAIDSKAKYEREQESISRGITVDSPILESDYVLVLQYLQYLFDIPQQSGFPWNGAEDPLCPWPTKPSCVLDDSIT